MFESVKHEEIIQVLEPKKKKKTYGKALRITKGIYWQGKRLQNSSTIYWHFSALKGVRHGCALLMTLETKNSPTSLHKRAECIKKTLILRGR